MKKGEPGYGMALTQGLAKYAIGMPIERTRRPGMAQPSPQLEM
jgi:hypothetical protein